MEKTPGKLLYKKIHEELKSEINGKVYAGGSLLPSERELCSRFGVERITVRKALELLVEEGLVEKRAGVGTIVKEYPLRLAPAINPNNILFVLPKSTNSADRITEPFNTALFYRIEKECKDRGFSLMYTTLGPDESLAEITNGNSIKGMILVSKFPDKQYDDCRRSMIPVVIVNNRQTDFICVDSDNENGAYEAVRLLCQQGHKRIGIITGIEGFSNTQDRLSGYKKALAEAGIDWQEQIMADGDWTFDGGYTAMKEILQTADPLPTAIFAMNDLTAIGAMGAIKEEGLTVPEDISVIGFDNVAQCEYINPKLSSVDVDVTTIAQAACRQLFDGIEHKADIAYKIVIPTKLVIRDSVSKPRQ